MPARRIQANSSSVTNTGSATVTLPSVLRDSTLLLDICFNVNASAISTVTDDAGNTWSLVTGSTNTTGATSIATYEVLRAKPSTSTLTVTVTFTAAVSALKDLFIEEVSGLASRDGNATSTGSTTATTSAVTTSKTPSGPGRYFKALCYPDTTWGGTVSGSFKVVRIQAGDGNADKVQTGPAAAESPTFTITSGAYRTSLVAYVVADDPPPPRAIVPQLSHPLGFIGIKPPGVQPVEQVMSIGQAYYRGTNADTMAITTERDVEVGEAIVVGIILNTTTATMASVTDSVGNTYAATQAGTSTASNGIVYTYTSILTTRLPKGSLITVDPTGNSSAMACGAVRITGIVAVDAVSSNVGNDAAPSSTIGTLANPHEVIIAVAGFQNYAGFSVDKAQWNVELVSGAPDAGTAYRTVAMASQVTDDSGIGFTSVIGASVQWAVQTVSFTRQGFGGGSTTNINPSGSISPGGSIIFSTGKLYAGSIAPSGAMQFMTKKLLAGATSPTGTTTLRTSKLFTGAIGPTGAIVLRTLKPLAGAVSPSGTLRFFVGKLVAGSITPAGALKFLTVKAFSGSTSPAGTLIKKISPVPFTGSIGPTGALVARKVALLVLSGAITPAGTLLRSTLKPVAGTLTSVGGIVLKTGKLVSGTITPTGAVTRKITPTPYTGSITPSGSLLKRITKTFAGAITPSGSATFFHQAVLILGGAISPAGALTRKTFKSFTGSVSPTGSLVAVRTVFVLLAGSISPAGTLVRSIGKPLAGSLSPAGALIKKTTKSFTGSISPSGSLFAIRGALLFLAGSISPTGTVRWQISRAFTGALSPIGSLTRQTRKTFTGSITPAGTLATLRVVLLSLSGSISPVGSLIKRTLKPVSGTIAPQGSVTWKIYKSFAGAITPGGVLIVSKTVFLVLAGSIALSGALTKRTAKTVTGALTLTGTLIKKVATSFAGSLDFMGSLVKRIAIRMAGAITPTGALATARSAIQLFLSGSISPTGTLTKRIGKRFAGSITPVGNLFRQVAGTALRAIVRLLFLRSNVDITATEAGQVHISTAASSARLDATTKGNVSITVEVADVEIQGEAP